jgi:Ca2+-binding EF-hand superfamily protein
MLVSLAAILMVMLGLERLKPGKRSRIASSPTIYTTYGGGGGMVYRPPPPRPEVLPPTLPALCRAILQADRNGNGQIDDRKMAAPQRPRMLVQYVNQLMKDCCRDIGSRALSAADQELLGQDAATLMARSEANRFESGDNDHDGHWNRREWLNHTGMLNWNSRLPPESIAWHFFEPGLAPQQFPETIAAQVDLNHNGAIDPAESLAAERLARQDFDLDGDNRLDLVERREMVAAAFVEDGLFRLCPETDRNGNGFLDPDERPAAQALLLPLYDLDKDGRLDDGELWLIARDGRFSGNPRPDGACVVPDRVQLFAARRLADGQELQAKRQPILKWLQVQLEGQMNPLLEAAARQAIWQKLVTAYDVDRNGVLDQAEAYRIYRQVAIREMPATDPPPPWWVAVVVMTEGIPGRDWRPIDPQLFRLVDVDGDGLFSKADRLVLRPQLVEKAKGRDLGQVLYVFWPVADVSADGKLGAEERPAALAFARERFDANGDGRLDDAEMASLMAAGTTRLRDDAIANWLTKVGRGADCNGDGLLDGPEERLARLVMLLAIDENHSQTLETWELDKLILDTGCQDYWDGQNARAVEQLRRYDYDGDGQLNAEERRRADMDLYGQGRGGIIAPPQEE